jgi:hypothetical protein
MLSANVSMARELQCSRQTIMITPNQNSIRIAWAIAKVHNMNSLSPTMMTVSDYLSRREHHKSARQRQKSYMRKNVLMMTITIGQSTNVYVWRSRVEDSSFQSHTFHDEQR